MNLHSNSINKFHFILPLIKDIFHKTKGDSGETRDQRDQIWIIETETENV